MNKIFSLIVIVLIFIVGKKIGEQAFNSESPSKQDIENKLIQAFKQAAKEINQNTPNMVDSETRMDKATVGPGTILTYHYTFPNYSSNEIESEWIYSELRERVTSDVCNSKKMKPSLQYGATYTYSYSGSDQKVIGAFQIKRKDCGYAAVTP